MEPNPAGIFEITFLHALHPELVQRERSLAFKGKPLTPPDNWADGQLDPSPPNLGRHRTKSKTLRSIFIEKSFE